MLRTLLIVTATTLASFAATPAGAQVASLGKGWLLDAAGSITSVPSEVISGRNSIRGSGDSQVLLTDPSMVRLPPNQSCTMTFRYRIITPSPSGFEYGFSSSTGIGSARDFGPSALIVGPSGSSGVVTNTFSLHNWPDYQAFFKIAGAGSIVIDDIRITDGSGRIVASENAEGPSLAAGPLNFQLTDAIVLRPDANSTLRSIAVKDLNGDGYPEVVATLTGDPPSNIPLPVIVLEASGQMRLAASDFFPTGVPSVKHSPLTLFADLNGDGLQDMVFAEAGWDGPCATRTGSRIGAESRRREISRRVVADPRRPADDQIVRDCGWRFPR